MTDKNKNLSILHIAPTPFFADRGCHMRVRGLILALNKLGVNNLLCTYHHGRDVEGVKAVRIKNIPGYTKLEAGPSPYKYRADILLLIKVCQTIWREKPDIIHGHLHEGSLIGWVAKWIFFWRRLPLVFDVQGSLVGELDAHGYFKKAGFLRRIFWTVEWLITRMPNHFVCSSGNSLAILREEFNIAQNKLTQVSDGTDIIIPSATETEKLRSQLNLPADKPIVIYTGALSAAKGLDSLCELIAATTRDKLDCHFLIIGYPVEELEDYLQAQGLTDRCSLAGRVAYESLSGYLSLADVAIEPKRAASGEASGKLLNYMAAGLSVVCYDNANNREMLGDAGYYGGLQNEDALLLPLKQALASPDEREQRGKQAKSRILEQFSWDSAAVKIYNIYQQI